MLGAAFGVSSSPDRMSEKCDARSLMIGTGEAAVMQEARLGTTAGGIGIGDKRWWSSEMGESNSTFPSTRGRGMDKWLDIGRDPDQEAK